MTRGLPSIPTTWMIHHFDIWSRIITITATIRPRRIMERDSAIGPTCPVLLLPLVMERVIPQLQRDDRPRRRNGGTGRDARDRCRPPAEPSSSARTFHRWQGPAR